MPFSDRSREAQRFRRAGGSRMMATLQPADRSRIAAVMAAVPVPMIRAFDDSREAAWVHGCLHRQEGDFGNAGYWYRRAGQPVAEGPIEAERRAIAEALTGQ